MLLVLLKSAPELIPWKGSPCFSATRHDGSAARDSEALIPKCSGEGRLHPAFSWACLESVLAVGTLIRFPCTWCVSWLISLLRVPFPCSGLHL